MEFRHVSRAATNTTPLPTPKDSILDKGTYPLFSMQQKCDHSVPSMTLCESSLVGMISIQHRSSLFYVGEKILIAKYVSN